MGMSTESAVWKEVQVVPIGTIRIETPKGRGVGTRKRGVSWLELELELEVGYGMGMRWGERKYQYTRRV
jgi:hypothetical protein